ncbi:uncharacterized protein B0P05DRAFT_524569 [Gilbertella persicaria]|uniref:uncharacterized protein n=1 Tax=Gilbertella persicaria TaxID=101096 RepID=UPI00221EB68C|nr:uncharacterized protein B0P05DRAFT_524569 [Gilbertella persicaria]KAI8095067.1 hypothetical protein B0P05DRAFT_524569 [Gilbertella persicaria]
MTAEHCVDYLSYQWSCDDLILTWRQMNKYHVSKDENFERNKSIRLQNALWRSMAKSCVKNLGKYNQLIDPSTVCWQKESDITWLYGPMYTNSCNEMEKLHYYSSALQGLKPVLKKHCNVTQIVPNCSDPILSYFDSFVLNDIHTPMLYSSRSSRFSSFSSIASSSSNSSVNLNHKSSVGVHFNPEIIEIEYQPEYPVSSSPHLQDKLRFMEDDEEDDTIDLFWTFLVQTALSIKSSASVRLKFLARFIFYHNHKRKSQLHYHPHLHLIVLLASMFKSVVSLTTTWLLYQSLLPISWILKKSISSPAGQQQKRASFSL